MVRRVDSGLHVVANHRGAAITDGHGAGVRIGQGDLVIRCLAHARVEHCEPLHLQVKPRDLLLQTGDCLELAAEGGSKY